MGNTIFAKKVREMLRRDLDYKNRKVQEVERMLVKAKSDASFAHEKLRELNDKGMNNVTEDDLLNI